MNDNIFAYTLFLRVLKNLFNKLLWIFISQWNFLSENYRNFIVLLPSQLKMLAILKAKSTFALHLPSNSSLTIHDSLMKCYLLNDWQDTMKGA